MVLDVRNAPPNPESHGASAIRSLGRQCRVVFIFLMCPVFGAAPVNSQQTTRATAAKEAPLIFEVASIKPSRPDDNSHRWDRSPGRFFIRNYTLRQMIRIAYALRFDMQVVGGPKWVDSQAFDIEAKVDDIEVAKMNQMTDEQRDTEWNAMLQSLLAERFGLRLRRSERKSPIYALVVAKSGARLTQSPKNETTHGLPVRSVPESAIAEMAATTVSMGEFADHLSRMPENDNRLIVDRTGLEGRYDFQLKWMRNVENGISEGSSYPGLFTALREQLGLELKPDKTLVDVVIVEAASQPEFD